MTVAQPFPSLELVLQQLPEHSLPLERGAEMSGEGLGLGPAEGWTPGSHTHTHTPPPPAERRKWSEGSCQGWRASSPQGPTQLSWPACLGLSWQRRRQSLGLPAGAPQTCILFREAPQPWQDQNKTGAPSQPTLRETDSRAMALPRPWPIPTTSTPASP